MTQSECEAKLVQTFDGLNRCNNSILNMQTEVNEIQENFNTCIGEKASCQTEKDIYLDKIDEMDDQKTECET